MRVYLMRPTCGGQWLMCPNPAEVLGMLLEGDEGSSYVVKIHEMTEEEIENAKEFDGW